MMIDLQEATRLEVKQMMEDRIGRYAELLLIANQQVLTAYGVQDVAINISMDFSLLKS